MTTAFVARHLERAGVVRVAAPLGEAFMFFTPEGERLWVPGWDPEFLHPTGGGQCEGAVFRTDAGGEEALWLIAVLEPEAGIAEYVRVVPGSRMGTVTVKAQSKGPFETAVHVVYRLTSLSPAGNDALAAFDGGFDDMMAEWASGIAAALRR
jgi:hypothetical protein